MQTKKELKLYCDQRLEEVRKYFDEVKKIADSFYTNADTMTQAQYQPHEHRLVGIYTFINTVYKEIAALKENYEAIYFTHLKVRAEIDNVKFVAESAGREARDYTEDLRITTAILEGWVENIEQLLATCRRNLFIDKKERKHI